MKKQIMVTCMTILFALLATAPAQAEDCAATGTCINCEECCKAGRFVSRECCTQCNGCTMWSDEGTRECADFPS